MSWSNAITDIQRIGNTSQYFLLAGSSKDHFAASAVFVFDLNAPNAWNNIKIPLTPAPWVSMACDCAGYEFILTGGEWMHHTWSNHQLIAHPQDVIYRTTSLWRVNSDKAIYCGGNQLVTITNQSSTAERFLNTPIGNPGAWLKTERIKRGKNLQELADSLRLHPDQLETLETDDYARLPGPTFEWGLIQAYARELGVDRPHLNCIHGIENKFSVLGGDKGLLLMDRGQGWDEVKNIPIQNHIIDVHCVSENEIYLCAGYGGVFRWNGGSEWLKYDTDPEAFMYSLCRYKDRTCVASLNLKSYWLDDTEAVPIIESKVATRFKTDGELLFGLGMNKFEVFDGEAWHVHELDFYKLFSEELEAMYSEAPSP